MATQTVNLDQINSIVKDGVPITEFQLDGSTLWTLPVVPYDYLNVNRSYVLQTITGDNPVSNASDAVVSRDGLVIAAIDASGNINVYSRSSTTSATWSLVDTILTSSDPPYGLTVSSDGVGIAYNQSINNRLTFKYKHPTTGYYSISDTISEATHGVVFDDNIRRIYYNKLSSELVLSQNIATLTNPDFRVVSRQRIVQSNKITEENKLLIDLSGVYNNKVSVVVSQPVGPVMVYDKTVYKWEEYTSTGIRVNRYSRYETRDVEESFTYRLEHYTIDLVNGNWNLAGSTELTSDKCNQSISISQDGKRVATAGGYVREGLVEYIGGPDANTGEISSQYQRSVCIIDLSEGENTIPSSIPRRESYVFTAKTDRSLFELIRGINPFEKVDISNVIAFPRVALSSDGMWYISYLGLYSLESDVPLSVLRRIKASHVTDSTLESSISMPVGSVFRYLSLGGSGSPLIINDTLYHTPPVYSLNLVNSVSFITEGQSATFKLNTNNVVDNTSVDYTITGVQAADIVEPLTGSFTVLDNTASIVINTVEDLLTEGNQNLTLRLDDDPSQSRTITIQDTSTTP